MNFRLAKSNAICIGIAFILLVCTVYVALALTPSSYAIGMKLLGQPVKGLVAGTPRPVRSDEWMVFTPYVQIAVNSNFKPHDSGSPYRESLKSFFALPVADWGAAFKPYYFAFAVLPPANAFSFFYLFDAFAFLIGWALFFKFVGVDAKLAIIGSLALFFSQFVQVWWTSNWGAFAFAPWTAVAWMAIDKRWVRVLVCAYVLMVWMLADVYPPFLYAFGLAMTVIVIGTRHDLLTARRVIDAGISAALAAVMFYAYFGDLIKIMGSTVYPGHRVSSGGGFDLGKLLAHIYPFAVTHLFDPLSNIANTNACEIAVVGSLIPIILIVFVDYRSFKKAIQSNAYAVLVMALGLLFVAAWMFFPIPAAIGKYVGLTFVPGKRLALGFGWILTALCLYLLSRCSCVFNFRRVAVFMAAMLCAIFIKYKVNAIPWRHSISWFDFVPVAFALMLALIVLYDRIIGVGRKESVKAFLHGTWSANGTPAASAPSIGRREPGSSGEHRRYAWYVLIAGAACVNLVTFGAFNPVQSAYPMFSMDKSKILAHLKQVGGVVADGAIAVPGDYGALINGAGISSFNNVMLSPQKIFFARYFGDLTPGQFNFVFNRYNHLSFNTGSAINVPSPDSVSLPLEEFVAQVRSGGNSSRAGTRRQTAIEIGPPAFHAFHPRVVLNVSNRACSLDAIDGISTRKSVDVNAGSVVSLGGWAGDGAGGALGEGQVVLEGLGVSYAASFTTGGKRPDVARAFGSREMLMSGYNLAASLRNVSPGMYSLRVVSLSNPSADCNLNRTIRVK